MVESINTASKDQPPQLRAKRISVPSSEQAIWEKLTEVSKKDFNKSMISYAQYSDLYKLTERFTMSTDHVGQNIVNWPNLGAIKFEILEFYI